MTAAATVRIRSVMDAAELIAFAQELAAAAREETLHRWAAGCAVEDKGEGVFDPVTEADRGAERAMREIIRARFPDHGISGEELEEEAGSSRWSWSLDPVDGTRSFMCRLPTWTTLIALLDDGRQVLGLIDAPCLDETYIGFREAASLIWKGQRSTIRTSGCTRLREARFSTTDPFLWAPPAGVLERILAAVPVTRYGHDGYGYARVAAGSLDLVVESGLKPHDYNALIPVVEGAGGHIGDWRGGTDFSAGQVIAAATRALYDEAVALISE